MKLANVRIQNFRGFSDETISFDDYTCLVGPNGCGKSTVLTALNIFFRNTASSVTDLVNLTEEDFHEKKTTDPIKITVAFVDLEPAAQTDFAHYFRQGQLIVSAVANWDDKFHLATVKQIGERLGIKAFSPFFKAADEGKLVSELKVIYADIQKTFKNLPAPGTKPAMIEALHDYESKNAAQCELLPSEDQFYGVSRAKNLLEKYVQWAYVPAVKEASGEQFESKKTALGILLERTVRSKLNFEKSLDEVRKQAESAYLKILDANRGELKALSDSLSKRIQEWAHPNARLSLKWNDDTSKAITISEPLAKILAAEGSFEGELARFGHGLQRSFLLALLQELASSGQVTGPKLILACEEPELYQHPPQARHLSSVLENLSFQNAQVLISTHSPHFVSGKGFESIRMFRKASKASEAHGCGFTFKKLSSALAAASGEKPITHEGLALKVNQALRPSLNEMFFTTVLVLVEGLEDVAYISTALTLMDKWEQFRRLGCHIVPATSGKSSMIQPLAVAKGMQIPTFVVFDSDGHKPDKSGSRKRHEGDNTTILKLAGVANPDPFPSGSLWRDDVVMWKSEIGDVVKGEFGEETYNKLGESVRKKYNLSGVGDLEKNATFIGYILTEGWASGVKSASLCKLCDCIVAFAESAREA